MNWWNHAVTHGDEHDFPLRPWLLKWFRGDGRAGGTGADWQVEPVVDEEQHRHEGNSADGQNPTEAAGNLEAADQRHADIVQSN